MLGLILIYFIGKQFYQLAETYGKSNWGFAILGVLSYYAGTAILGLIIGFTSPNFLEDSNSFVISLIGIPIGALSCYIFYSILKKNWSKNSFDIYDDIDRIGDEVKNDEKQNNSNDINQQ